MTEDIDRLRRLLVTTLCASPFVFPNVLHANSLQVNFYYARSGRFTAYGSDNVFSGGLLIDPDIAGELEQELTQRSKAAGYLLDLTVGTNRNLPALLSLSLEVLSEFDVGLFFAATLTKEGEIEPDILTPVRTQHEADFFSAG
ncbi:hypothetical protein [Labrenzia sp. OB1]|uniref:hypothetical protein n=1 Tax=Labrenzia sp. OB1 TaxID=1561204 RepID=UPI0007B1BFD9|nr:hypothetical protein [Labrenzia sp. OB1]KZM47733.1 hypothetical protein OA90_24580 [Labrenzia sp. OB1]